MLSIWLCAGLFSCQCLAILLLPPSTRVLLVSQDPAWPLANTLSNWHWGTCWDANLWKDALQSPSEMLHVNVHRPLLLQGPGLSRFLQHLLSSAQHLHHLLLPHPGMFCPLLALMLTLSSMLSSVLASQRAALPRQDIPHHASVHRPSFSKGRIPLH